MAIGVLESQYKPNMNQDDAVALAISSIKAGIARDSASGDGADLLIITKDGIVPDYVLSYLLLSIIIKERKGDVVISINSSTALEELARLNSCNISSCLLYTSPSPRDRG